MRTIDADALKELITEDIQNGGSDIDFDRGFECGLKEAIEFIDNAPTVERPRGNWNPYDGNSYTEGFRLMCSKCGFIHTFIYHHTAQYRFCPNCGADMRGGSQ